MGGLSKKDDPLNLVIPKVTAGDIVTTSDAKSVQEKLNKVGYQLAVDGVVGPMTKGAIIAFQRAYGLTDDGVAGPKTIAKLNEVIQSQGHPAVPAAHGSEATWMPIAVKELGEKEVVGSKDNPRILEYGRSVDYNGGKPTQNDEVPWCSIFVSWCLQQAGYKDTNSAWAGSYDHYGVACDAKHGAVITLKRTDGSTHHVTFLDHVDSNGNFVCLGGNQSNAVRYSTYGKGEIKSIRWPVKA